MSVKRKIYKWDISARPLGSPVTVIAVRRIFKDLKLSWKSVGQLWPIVSAFSTKQ